VAQELTQQRAGEATRRTRMSASPKMIRVVLPASSCSFAIPVHSKPIPCGRFALATRSIARRPSPELLPGAGEPLSSVERKRL
jgi:hypothetical protein